MEAGGSVDLPVIETLFEFEPTHTDFTLSLRDQMLPTPVPRKARPMKAEVPLPNIVVEPLEAKATQPTQAERPFKEAALATASTLPEIEEKPAKPVARPDPGLGFAERKAEMRAAVRRARQRQQRRDSVDAGERPEVLLLEPDDTIRAQLADVLAQFGFSARAVASVRDADALMQSAHFVATFIGLGDQDVQAVGLCTRLRAMPRAVDRPLAVVAMVEKDRHTDRVRMELAGADAVIFRPVNRGHVARALEDSGVRLPRDPRAQAVKRRSAS